jgi:hypothetical protein
MALTSEGPGPSLLRRTHVPSAEDAGDLLLAERDGHAEEREDQSRGEPDGENGGNLHDTFVDLAFFLPV